MKRVKISPSILSADFSMLREAAGQLEKGGADYIHCDVMDGVFVSNLTFGFKAISDIKKHTSLPMDVHLMIVQPERYIKKFVEAGAHILTVHAEACADIYGTISQIKGLGARAGLAVSPDTKVESVFKYLDSVDLVLIMSVYPGFAGQGFIPESLDKISRLKAEIDRRGLDVDIEVDGGIYLSNVCDAVRAGVNIVVAGNAIFKEPDRISALAELKQKLEQC